jgi:hypothetical protein
MGADEATLEGSEWLEEESEMRGTRERSMKWEVWERGRPTSTRRVWAHEESKQRGSEVEVGKHPRHQYGLEESPKGHFAGEMVKCPRRELEFEGNLEDCKRHWSWFVEDLMNNFELNFCLVLTFVITILCIMGKALNEATSFDCG